MKNNAISLSSFGKLFEPASALVFYETNGYRKETYVEYFDIDDNGFPVNAHPLTIKEAKRLAESLNRGRKREHTFLRSEGLTPSNLLHLDASGDGQVIWFTPPGLRKLYFSDSIGICSGEGNVPALLWSANRKKLSLYALDSSEKPVIDANVYHAPFPNVYDNGKVCMGSVDVNIGRSVSLEQFTSAWEDYFFNSYFSHLVSGHNPVKGNCATLWKRVMETGSTFPTENLLPMNITIKNIIS